MHDYMDVELNENQNLLCYIGCINRMVINFINITLFHLFHFNFWLTSVITFQMSKFQFFHMEYYLN
jgi:hypothetical protein